MRLLAAKYGKMKDKSRHAQMKIQQTAFMLLAVTLLFVLVGLAVLGFKLAGMKGTASGLEEENAKLLVSKLANSPEFACGDAFPGRISCIDADKVMMLKSQESKYSGFWGVADIEIRKIYPKRSGTVVCTTSNYPNCNLIEIKSTKIAGTYYSNFISLCRKELIGGTTYDRCDLARLLVSYEKKT
jgi:hypothetical protein